MNTKKIIFGIFAMVSLIIASCTSNSADDSIYEVGVDKTKIEKPGQRSVDKTKIKKPAIAVDKTKISKGPVKR